MAVSLKPTGRGGRSRQRAAMSDINVTPLVDVMLVLLVIFMVTAPLMTVGIPVDLPKTRAPNINESTEPLTVSVNKEGKIYIQDTEVQLDTLLPKVQAIMTAKPETRIFVRGDESVAYRRIMEVMGTLHSAGYNKVALLTELPKTEKSGTSK
jgi:biopolymer transport protein TolR